MTNPMESGWLSGSLLVRPAVVMGAEYHVDATNGDDSNSGLDWDNSLGTWDAAINKCGGDAGEVIYMAPWHAESIATSTALALDTAGISHIGLQCGNQRPTITLGTDAGATIGVTAANQRISGIKLVSAVINCTAGITASSAGDGLQVDNCIITDGGAALEMVIGISLAASCDGCKILNNEFYTVPAGGCASAIKLVGDSARTVIANNIIQGDYSVSAIDLGTAVTYLVTIRNNFIVNVDADPGNCVKAYTGTTGLVVRNIWAGGHSMAGTYVGDAMVANWNYATGAVTKSGILEEPAEDSDT